MARSAAGAGRPATVGTRGGTLASYFRLRLASQGRPGRRGSPLDRALARAARPAPALAAGPATPRRPARRPQQPHPDRDQCRAVWTPSRAPRAARAVCRSRGRDDAVVKKKMYAEFPNAALPLVEVREGPSEGPAAPRPSRATRARACSPWRWRGRCSPPSATGSARRSRSPARARAGPAVRLSSWAPRGRARLPLATVGPPRAF